jgi:hypothetical protein
VGLGQPGHLGQHRRRRDPPGRILRCRAPDRITADQRAHLRNRNSYGEATGITQTVRNYGASLGFAILGTILITEFRSRITSSLTAKGLPGPAASAEAGKIAQLQGGNGNIASIPQFIRADFAGATREVLYGMCVVMAVAGFVALRGLRRGPRRRPASGSALGLSV